MDTGVVARESDRNDPSAQAKPPGRVWRRSRAMRRFLKNRGAVIGAVVLLIYALVALFAPFVATHEIAMPNLRNTKAPPSLEHWFGTDALGRDLFSRLVFGARISFVASLSAVGAALAVGTGFGMIAGYYGGRLDELAMRVVDIMLAFPGILLAILVVSILGAGLPQLIVAVSIFSIPVFARLARGSTLAVRDREYVQAIRATGGRDWRILTFHVLPNIFAPLLVQATLRIGTANLSIATLGFLGLGAQPPTPEWGLMIADGRNHLTTSPHIALLPGFVLMGLVLAVNLLGDGLRDALDPR